MSDRPAVVSATARYEAWVDRATPTVARARAEKHGRMASGVFPFLRATYYRWIDLVRDLPAAPGPRVAAVGDLHVENFGTWRDTEGRLVWGINDYDEASPRPAALDLLRLATSVELAGLHGNLDLPAGGAVDLLVRGYARALAAGGVPVVLDRPDPPPLVDLLPPTEAQHWWQSLAAEPLAHDVPGRAITLLLAALPAGSRGLVVRRRTAGLGSRDHLRLVGTAQLDGAPVVREIKARTPSATVWLAGPGDAARARKDSEAALQLVLTKARHVADPALRFRTRWVVRRLAPWSDRIELTALQRRGDIATLLEWMGVETANVHLASASPGDLRVLTRRRGRSWLTESTKHMVAATTDDFETWRHHQRRH